MTLLALPGWAFLVALANHLWQSTFVATIGLLLVVLFRKGEARLRYGIVLATSVKFLVPFTWLATVGSLFPWPAALPAPEVFAASPILTMSQPFALGASAITPGDSGQAPLVAALVPRVLIVAWVCGGLVLLSAQWRRWRQVSILRSRAEAQQSGREVDIWRRLQGQRSDQTTIAFLVSGARVEPCVIGVVRPVLLWPRSLLGRLGDEHLEAVLAHELSHVHRRHNLTSIVHMVVEACFWFYPPVWWIGARLVEERERTSDEDVLRRGGPPAAYAEGILKVCEVRLVPPPACSAGISSSPLVARIEAIMSHHVPRKLGWSGRLLVTAIGTLVLAGPVAAGFAAGSSDRSLPHVIAPFVHVAPPDGAARLTLADATARPVQSAPGQISGSVSDHSGRPIADVEITVADASTGAVVRQGASDANGRYALTGVPSGVYELRFEYPAFKRVTPTVTTSPTTGATVDVRLPLGDVSESITIVSDGQTAGGRGVSGQAEADLADRITQDPQGASAYLALARLYYADERFAESEAVAVRGLDLLEQQAASERLPAPRQGSQGGDVTPPTKIKDFKPVFPSEAGQASGIVFLQATISAAGTVKDVKVVRSAPPFDQAATAAVRQWLYTPTLLNGVPTDVVVSISVNFRHQ